MGSGVIDRPHTLPDLLRTRAEQEPEGVATFHRDPSGRWTPTTWSALWTDVRRAAGGFRTLGLQPGDRIAILARTCREWQIAEFGALLAGAAVVGVDAHAPGAQVAWILDHADVAAVVADTPSNGAKAAAGVQRRLKFVMAFDGTPSAASSASNRAWRDVMASDESLDEPPQMPNADDPAMLIYTSGTTGTPKGLEYTHRQLMASCWATMDEFPDLGESNRLICWLPMAPLFQRVLNLVAFASRSVTYFVEDPRDIMVRVGEVRPTAFASVPRFYEKLHQGIQEHFSRQTGIRRHLVDAALATGAEWSRCTRNGRRPTWSLRVRHALLDRLVLRKVRAVMGGNIKWMISGSAAAPVWLLEFFHSIGLLILEAYGVSENPVPVAANRSNAYRFGSVGRPFTLNDVRIASDSEVLVKGPAMFREYRGEGRPVERFTDDGYYRTGDFGRVDKDGFLYLTGRVAEMIKTSTGRRISPAGIEAVYKRSAYVDQIVVVGNNRPCLVGLVTLNLPAVNAAIGSTAQEAELSASPRVRDLINREFQRLGAELSRHEQVRAFGLLPAPLSMENGELTSNLKLRRTHIEARHAALIQSLYTTVESPVGTATA